MNQALLNHHLEFDVFRFMRDHNIEYGFTKTFHDWLDLVKISGSVASFIERNAHLLHADAKLGFLGAKGRNSQGEESNRSDAFEAQAALFATDAKQDKPMIVDPIYAEVDEDPETLYLADAFSAWLNETRTRKVSLGFEFGSLAFLRGPSHRALMEFFEEAPFTPSDEFPVHSLSASMFLPQRSVWNWRHKSSRARPAAPTPSPNNQFEVALFDWDTVAETGLALVHDNWELMADDFADPEAQPMPHLGHTSIDERSFLFQAPNGRFLNFEDCISCQVAAWWEDNPFLSLPGPELAAMPEELEDFDEF